MEEKINIAAILKDKPQGTKLYDWLHNIDVELDTISTTDTETVVWCTNETNNNTICHRGYSEFGTERGYPDGLQILFPSKKMRDWAKFSWKKGDVLSNGEGDYCVFKEFAHSSYQTSKAVFVKRNKESIHSDSCLLDTKDWHKASHSCTATYINTIEKELSGKLNMETLEIEKVHPEFKDGDILFVECKGSAFIEIFNYFKNNGDLYDHASLDTTTHELDISGEYKIFKENIIEIRLATDSEKKQLFLALEKKGKAWDAGKKMIIDLMQKVELKPFDKVLVRHQKTEEWRANIFSNTDKTDEYLDYVCVNGRWEFCIPYEDNESLLGTTKDVEG
jgi:hypothetical protein|nr:MAG TPA: hypothetical protein [Caudoviricetes sp.]